MALIPTPQLDPRNEDRLAAEAIARTSGAMTVELLQAQIRERQEWIKYLQSGGPPPAYCPELTNANPSAPHTVLLEATAWLLGQFGWRLNLVPEKNLIQFARLFGIELRPATAAQTTLRFVAAAPPDTDVTIPAGTQAATQDGAYLFATAEELVIVSGNEAGDVAATRAVTGHTLLTPNALTRLDESLAFVQSVTNPDAVDSGSALETVESALARMRAYQRRGERLVTAPDIEEAIREEILRGAGVVRAYPFIKDGDFNNRHAGHTSVIVMTGAGDAVDDATRGRINALLEQVIGNQFTYILDPFAVDFNVEATIRLTALAARSAVLAAVENRLRGFYQAAAANFGRAILRSEIIATIEGTEGVDRIESAPDAPIIASPLADARLLVWQTPRLVNVTLHIAE